MSLLNNQDNKATQEFLSDFPEDITLSNDSFCTTEIDVEEDSLIDSLPFIPESDVFSDTFSLENTVLSMKEKKKDDNKLFTGFTTCNNKKIFVNEETLLKRNEEEKFIKEGTFKDKKENIEIKTEENSLKNLEEILTKNSENKFVSGFTTGNNKQVLINKENLEKTKKIFDKNKANLNEINKENLKNNKIYQEFYSELYPKKEKEKEKLITTGFTTGNKKSISVKQENLINKIKKEEKEKEIFTSSTLSLSTLKESNEEEKVKKIKKDALKIKNSFFPANYPFRSYQQPEKGHFSDEERKFEFMKQLFKQIKQKFNKEDPNWLLSQFKFSWLSLLIRKVKSSDYEEELTKQIQKRKRREFSLLRRICEGDDIPNKYMVLLVLNTFPDKLELFDGSYSILCTVDKEISKMLLSQKIRIYSLIKISNAQLLIKPPVNILEINCPIFHLSFNSISLTKKKHKLGYQKKCTFLKKLNEINRLGGSISGIDLTINKIIEEKALVKCFDYRKEVELNFIEKEIEKIVNLAKESNKEIKIEQIRIIKYVKCIVKDNTGECLLIWYNPNYDSIKKNDLFRFINLSVNEKMIGLSLFTNFKKTFAKKLN